MCAARTFDINVTIGWIKGLEVGDRMIQAVWEAFGLPQQTELQKIAPIFDAQGGHVGMVTWNESFGIQDVLVESEEVECYLEIAFWQYTDPGEDPVAIGFKRVDISDFHKNHAKVLEFPVEIDQQSHLAVAHIQLSTHEKVEAPPSDPAAPSPDAPAPEAIPLPPAVHKEAASAPDQNGVPSHHEEERRASHAAAAEETRRRQLVAEEEETRRAEAERHRQEEAAAAAQAHAEREAAEARRLAQVAEAERAARSAAEAEAAALQVAAAAAVPAPVPAPAMDLQAVSTTHEVALMNGAQRVAMFRSLVAHFCGVSLPPEPGASLSLSVPIQDDPIPLGSIVAAILTEGDHPDQQEVQGDVQERLLYEVLAHYLARLPNERELQTALRHEVARTFRTLLHLPATAAAACCPAPPEARRGAFEAARRRAAQQTAATQATDRPVFYFASGSPPPPTPLDVIVRSVPTRAPDSDRIDPDALRHLLAEDVAAGLTPCLLDVRLGLSGPSFCDDIAFLLATAKSFGLVLHLEGPGLILLATAYPEAQKWAHAFKDPDLAVSMVFPVQYLFSPLGHAVPGCMAVISYPGADETVASLHVAPGTHLHLYTKLRTLGLAALRAPIARKVHEAAHLVGALQQCACVELLTDPTNWFTVRFRFVAPGEGTRDALKTNEVNSMLHQMFLQSGLSPTEALNAVSFQSNAAGVQFFEYCILTHDLDTAATDALRVLFERCSQTLQSIIQYSTAMQAAVEKNDSLIIMPDISKAPLALACFRLIPTFYRSFDRLTESHVRDLNSINGKLIALLQKEDPAFHGLDVNGQTFIVVGSDAGMSIIFTEEYVERLAAQLKAAVAKLECDDEILSKIQAEITKRGIEVAEKQIMQSKLAEGQQESIIRMLPVVGSLANWWAPMEKAQPSESFSFDLRTSTLTKQVPGKLKPLPEGTN